MKGYLKGYYGYKNFGDELLLLGVLDYFEENYDLDELIIETQNTQRLQDRIEQNQIFLNDISTKINYQELAHSTHQKLFFFFKKIFYPKYKKYHKFFGGGEVLNPERKFPHDGRNLYLGDQLRRKKGNYTLLGGIGTPNNKKTKKLYSKIIPNAKKIILREKDSYETVLTYLSKENKQNAILHEDFSASVLRQAEDYFKAHKEKRGSEHRRYDKVKDIIFRHQEKPYILINLNNKSRTEKNINRIKDFIAKYPDHKKIFFPCDMQDDLELFFELSHEIDGLELFDRTEHSLIETLHLFYKAEAGIGARLHFLYPLKIFKIPLEAIAYKDKVRKLILSD